VSSYKRGREGRMTPGEEAELAKPAYEVVAVDNDPDRNFIWMCGVALLCTEAAEYKILGTPVGDVYACKACLERLRAGAVATYHVRGES
jgi:hypothetical protein